MSSLVRFTDYMFMLPVIPAMNRWAIFDSSALRTLHIVSRRNLQLETHGRSAHCSLLTDSSSTSLRLSRIRFVLLADSIVTGKDCAAFWNSNVPVVTSTI